MKWILPITKGSPNSVGVRRDKIHPKFIFFDKIEIKMTHLVFFFLFFVFTVSSLLEPFGSHVLSTFKLLSCTNNKKNARRLRTLKPTVAARSSINPIKMVQTHPKWLSKDLLIICLSLLCFWSLRFHQNCSRSA